MCNFGFWFKNTKSCACLFFQCVFVAKVVNKTYFAGKEWLSDATLPIFNPTSPNLYQALNLLLINDFYYPKIILEFLNQLSFLDQRIKKSYLWSRLNFYLTVLKISVRSEGGLVECGLKVICIMSFLCISYHFWQGTAALFSFLGPILWKLSLEKLYYGPNFFA